MILEQRQDAQQIIEEEKFEPGQQQEEAPEANEAVPAARAADTEQENNLSGGDIPA